MNHDKRNQAGIQCSLQVLLPFLPICRIIPQGPVQRVANVLDAEVPDICHALLIQAMNANPDHRDTVEDHHQSKTNAHQLDSTGQSQGRNLFDFGAGGGAAIYGKDGKDGEGRGRTGKDGKDGKGGRGRRLAKGGAPGWQ